MPLTPIKISVFYYKHDGHIPQNFYYSDDIDEIWGLGENEYPGLTKVLLSSNSFNPIILINIITNILDLFDDRTKNKSRFKRHSRQQ